MSANELFLPAMLEDIVSDRFGRYSKYIIQDRAIPDVRDGLKPVQRRILYAMYEAGNTPDKPYTKAAKTVGDVMGHYHPHGDASIYDGMVRMAQPWKMNHPLIDGHGNWGSMDDDPAAAMRYTEARLAKISMELLRDIEKRTVVFNDNFDNTEKEPSVLPARFPNLLVNGSSGISAGFATEIPPHNLREVIDACMALIDQPDLTVPELMKIVKGPDFPTGGIIMGEDGIQKAFETGKGRIVLRAKTEIEKLRGGRQQIVITEIPYMVVKSRLVTAMETIRVERKIEGLAEVRDESGRDGLRIVVELRKDADAEGILAYMLKRTDLQVTYNYNMVAIVNRTPRQLGIKEMIEAYIAHQKEVVTYRSQYDLDKAKDRAHILDGLIKALNLLDDIIATIKGSKNRQDAQENLIEKYGFSERQADAILTLQLYRLTNLEITSLQKDRDEVGKQIDYLQSVLGSHDKLMSVIKEELAVIRDEYGRERQSVIQNEVETLKVSLEVMVNPEDVLMTLSYEGYIKRTSKLSYTRSGGETESTGLKEGDHARFILEVNTIDNLLIFTEKGQYYSLPVHQIPEYRWRDNGTPIVNVIPIDREDRIVNVIPVKNFADPVSLLFITRNGQVKRTDLNEYETNRMTAIAACRLADDDAVIDVQLSHGARELLLVTKLGMSIRFAEEEVNATGRVSAGVKGMTLSKDDEVVAALQVEGDEGEVLVVSDLGYVKRSLLLDYSLQRRGGKGAATFEFKTGKRIKPNGTKLVAAFMVKEAYDLNAIISDGTSQQLSTEDTPITVLRAIGRQKFKLGKTETIVEVIPING